MQAPSAPRLIRARERAGTLAIASDWMNAGELYAGTFEGLFRSRECVGRWEFVPSPWMIDAAISSVAAARDGFLLLGRYDDPISLSTDGGQTWERTTFSARSQGISASPAAPGLAYAFLHRVSLRGLSGFARTVDFGRTWEVRNVQVSTTVISADPLDSDTVFAASPAGISRSRDGGSTFHRLETFGPLEGGNSVSALATSADGSRIWAAAQSGELFRSPDHGENWEQVQNTAYAGYLVGLAASPFDSRVLFALTSTGALWAYREPEGGELPVERSCRFDAILGFGRIWQIQVLPRGDAGCPLEPERPVTVYMLPLAEAALYWVDYAPDYWLQGASGGSLGIADKAGHPLPSTGVRAAVGSVQRFEAATMVWLPRPDGSHVILVLQDGASQEFPDRGENSGNGAG